MLLTSLKLYQLTFAQCVSSIFEFSTTFFNYTAPASLFECWKKKKQVANWLIRLTPEQHERFNQLRDRFSTEMEEREAIQDMEDSQLRQDEETYLEMREQEDWRRGQVNDEKCFFFKFWDKSKYIYIICVINIVVIIVELISISWFFF